jgi:hypothetical protein
VEEEERVLLSTDESLAKEMARSRELDDAVETASKSFHRSMMDEDLALSELLVQAELASGPVADQVRQLVRQRRARANRQPLTYEELRSMTLHSTARGGKQPSWSQVADILTNSPSPKSGGARPRRERESVPRQRSSSRRSRGIGWGDVMTVMERSSLEGKRVDLSDSSSTSSEEEESRAATPPLPLSQSILSARALLEELDGAAHPAGVSQVPLPAVRPRAGQSVVDKQARVEPARMTPKRSSPPSAVMAMAASDAMTSKRSSPPSAVMAMAASDAMTQALFRAKREATDAVTEAVRAKEQAAHEVRHREKTEAFALEQQKRAEGAERRVAIADEALQKSQRRMAELEQQLAMCEKHVESDRAEISRIATEHEVAQNRVSELEHQVAELRATTEQAEAALNEVTSVLPMDAPLRGVGVDHRVRWLVQQYRRLAAELETEEMAHSRDDSRLFETQTRLQEAESRYEALEQHCASLDARHREAAAKLLTAQNEVEELWKLKAENTALRRRVEEAEALVAEAERKCSAERRLRSVAEELLDRAEVSSSRRSVREGEGTPPLSAQSFRISPRQRTAPLSIPRTLSAVPQRADPYTRPSKAFVPTWKAPHSTRSAPIPLHTDDMDEGQLFSHSPATQPLADRPLTTLRSMSKKEDASQSPDTERSSVQVQDLDNLQEDDLLTSP